MRSASSQRCQQAQQKLKSKQETKEAWQSATASKSTNNSPLKCKILTNNIESIQQTKNRKNTNQSFSQAKKPHSIAIQTERKLSNNNQYINSGIKQNKDTSPTYNKRIDDIFQINLSFSNGNLKNPKNNEQTPQKIQCVMDKALKNFKEYINDYESETRIIKQRLSMQSTTSHFLETCEQISQGNQSNNHNQYDQIVQLKKLKEYFMFDKYMQSVKQLQQKNDSLLQTFQEKLNNVKQILPAGQLHQIQKLVQNNVQKEQQMQPIVQTNRFQNKRASLPAQSYPTNLSAEKAHYHYEINSEYKRKSQTIYHKSQKNLSELNKTQQQQKIINPFKVTDNNSIELGSNFQLSDQSNIVIENQQYKMNQKKQKKGQNDNQLNIENQKNLLQHQYKSAPSSPDKKPKKITCPGLESMKEIIKGCPNNGQQQQKVTMSQAIPQNQELFEYSYKKMLPLSANKLSNNSIMSANNSNQKNKVVKVCQINLLGNQQEASHTENKQKSKQIIHQQQKDKENQSDFNPQINSFEVVTKNMNSPQNFNVDLPDILHEEEETPKIDLQKLLPNSKPISIQAIDNKAIKIK